MQAFAERLRQGDPELAEEHERAFRVVMVEGFLPWLGLGSLMRGVRNAMMAAIQRLELWPPLPTPRGIEEDDCCYEVRWGLGSTA